jgi:serine protease AprX
MTELPQSDPSGEDRIGFTPEVLDKSVLSIPLLRILQQEKQRLDADPHRQPEAHHVVIDLNLEYGEGRDAARRRADKLIKDAVAEIGSDKSQGIDSDKSQYSDQYLFARLEGAVLRRVVERDGSAEPVVTTDDSTVAASSGRAIYRVWPDFEVRPLISKSISTVKADAARISFAAMGDEIVWAVLDSGIDRDHPHFKRHGNLKLEPALEHRDFTGSGDALKDDYGHGTHVAGILAGELQSKSGGPRSESGEPQPGDEEIRAFTRHRDEHGEVTYNIAKLSAISGMAPRCKLLSLKVLDSGGRGVASSLIAAIQYVQQINGYGRRLRVHGMNLSVGYDFEPEWFACGQSPLCVEVNQLVRSGVVVVVAAGNTGYGYHKAEGRATAFAAGMGLTINDPGNADLAITVGSTHRDMPHVYGVSYFSSKGPTGDGRLKPDVIAPGEKILSCAAGKQREEAKAKGADCNYVEDSGTSMAAPHVSGVIAAFLSVRREFIGRPDAVKDIFLDTATDLRRDRNFQGRGLVDLMRAIQSV